MWFRYFQIMIVLIFSVRISAHAQQAMIQVMDDTGYLVTLSQPAKRIITLAPHITETLFTIGAKNQIVGTVTASMYPDEAAQIPRVGNHLTLDMETILALRPDLVIAWGEGIQKAITQLRKSKIPVFVSAPKTAEDIANAMAQFGQLTGHIQQAEQAAAVFRRQFYELKQKYEKKSPVRVFLQIWHRPIMTVGNSSFLHHALHNCRGVNLFGDQVQSAFTVGMDNILQRQPDMILGLGLGMKMEIWRQIWQRYASLKAIQSGKFLMIDIDTLSRPGPGFLDGNEKLCHIIDQGR